MLFAGVNAEVREVCNIGYDLRAMPKQLKRKRQKSGINNVPSRFGYVIIIL